jgi:hypothetical protein
LDVRMVAQLFRDAGKTGSLPLIHRISRANLKDECKPYLPRARLYFMSTPVGVVRVRSPFVTV